MSGWQAPAWTPDEDAVLRSILKSGGGSQEMVRRLPHRSRAACRVRLSALRRSDGEQPTERQDRKALELSSSALLRALLGYGARKSAPKGLPGLSNQQFIDLCREHGIGI